MSSRSRNVNLNKEPFEGGYVRHWKRQWVSYGDKIQDDKGAWTLKLIKWVPTDVRVTSRPARQPHIKPVTDLSLVPGARLDSDTAAPTPAAGQLMAGMADAATMAAAAAAAAGQPATAVTVAMGDMQQPDGMAAAAAAQLAAATAMNAQQAEQWQHQQQAFQAYASTMQYAAATGAAGAAVPTATVSDGGQIPRVGSLNALSMLEVASASQQDTAAATASAAAAHAAYVLPSPSVATGGALAYSHPSGSQLQLQTTGSDFANYAAGAPSAGGAGTTSGYTAGTERTDSDALGRLPHAGGAAASEYTDSMDVDVDGAAGASQGGASQQVSGRIGVVVAGSMDTAGDLDDMDSEEAAAEDEDAEDGGDGDDDDDGGADEDDVDDDEEDEGYADDGLDDDGLAGVGDMP